MSTVPIETERLRLRRFRPADAAALSRYRSDPAVALYQSWTGMTLHEASAFIAGQPRDPVGRHDHWFQLAIAEKATDHLVGDIGICVKAPGTTAEIGFSVGPEVQRRGYGLEACRAAIDFIFAEFPVEIIEAVIDARNTSAIALVTRLGMLLDGTAEALFKGEVCSEHRFVYRRDAIGSRSSPPPV